jgi:hypothetical protein
MPAVNAAIIYLTQNDPIRKAYLKTSLYFTFKHFNAKPEHRYPVIIFHEGDYDPASQEEILCGIRASCRDLVSFQALHPDDFKLPAHIDEVKMNQCIDHKPTPYWRNVGYRKMCRWWMINMHKYVSGYDYVMRLDDDSIIEEPINQDLFAWADQKQLVYASNLVHVDCGLCNFGMYDFFAKTHTDPTSRAILDKMFINQEVDIRGVKMMGFRALLGVTGDLKIGEAAQLKLKQPIIYFNNFFITKTAFWRQEAVQKTLADIDATGNIFYYRWGDAPLQSLVVALHAKPEEVSKCKFAYSKRLQREAFPGNEKPKVFHAYMPVSYTDSSSAF